jgi:hypothetical protein
MELYDENADGVVEKSELAMCPPLLSVFALYDADNNSQLSAQEIANRVTAVFSAGIAVMPVDCTVTANGRPLVGATVRLRPVAMFGESLQDAEGITDTTGVARPTIAAGEAAESLQGKSAVYPGLYHVEITHPDRELPSRYNTQTELGVEVDPRSREGGAARLGLKT